MAKRYDINANPLFKWKRKGGRVAPGTTRVRADRRGRPDKRWRPGAARQMPGVESPTAGNAPAGLDEFRRPSALECRPGVIEIDLHDGARVRVDAFVNTRALVRVLSALKRHA